MKILVVGGGGREHALAWKLAQSVKVRQVFVAPGNAGTANEPGLSNIPFTSIPELIKFAQDEQINFTVVGPEAPLSQGIVDMFIAAGLKIFGSSKAATQLESSKEFAKNFMTRHGIATADYATFTDVAAAHEYVRQRGAPIVVKADGLAAGKGVVVAMNETEAHQAIDMMLTDKTLGAAGGRLVIEEYVQGEEASFIVMVDGQNILPLATSQDHKRLLNNDLGPNTGGMGAYSPAALISPEIHARVMREVIRPTVQGMAKDGIRYTGFLYAGLMISKDGSPKTLEFNCRMGDPETQPIMLRLKSDFAVIMEHAISGTLDKVEANWDRRIALGIVMASANYPGVPRQGDVIRGLPQQALTDAHVFHAGTALENDEVVTSGGRVLCVTALGENVKVAQSRAYELANNIHFDGCQMRSDIGYRAIRR